MELPADLAARWQAAHTELDRAQANHRRPGFSDELSELDDRLTTAHRDLAAVYDQVADVDELPDVLVAAARTAAIWHRDEGARCRRSEVSHA
jgi:hypothetical protein